MNRAFLSEFTSLPWAMESAALEAFLVQISSLPLLDVAAAGGGSAGSPRRARMAMGDGGIATIPISGVLMKSVPAWMRFYGVDATGYDEIAEDLAQALADPQTNEIRLKVSSPGGQVAGVKEIADAIFEARVILPMSAQIDDIGASAAYLLASQAGSISAGKNAVVGSIGVVAAFVDSSRLAENVGLKVYVIASGPHKGMGIPGAPITAEQVSAMQEVINGMASNFIDDVVRGLGMKREDVEKVATGRVWLAAEAKAHGLIQSISTTPTKAAAGPVGTAAKIETQNEEETNMADSKNPAAAAPEVPVAARRIATPSEMKAAFPSDPQFAMEQLSLEGGATLQEAQAAFASVQTKRLEAAQKENETLRKAARVSAGASPLPTGGASAEANGQDFMALVAQHMESTGCTKLQAMSAMCKKHPDLYAAFDRKLAAK